jgi:ferredoxin
MSTIALTIDGQKVEVEQGQTILAAARKLGIDIPTLCHLEKCGPLNTCQVCLVKINANGQSRLAPSCGTIATENLVVESETVEVHDARRTALELLFSDHVGDCLSPCHRLCPLLLNIPVMIRQIEGGRFEEAAATVFDALPLPSVLGRICHHPCEQGCRRGNWDSPAAIRDMEQFVAAQNHAATVPHIAPCKSATGKSVALVGAGPAGLAAAYCLARKGHSVTVVDRREKPGGALRSVPEGELPAAELNADIELLRRMGIEFKQGLELGGQITIGGLLMGFQAVLLAVGESDKSAIEKFGVSPAGNSIKTDPNTCATNLPGVFACGSAVKPFKQVIRAMAEGRAAAECVHQFLNERPVRRPEKPFSSIMGRIDPGELRQFLRNASPSEAAKPCDRCRGLNRREAVDESARCLHCDCRSSGECLLQHYAQAYDADASRFKSERRPFEQFSQPGGVIFEPGKCILCGICVKLTEMAREPLGLSFVGRGFDVRVAAPFDREINDGLRTVAAECVKHCPTGALAFPDKATES